MQWIVAVHAPELSAEVDRRQTGKPGAGDVELLELAADPKIRRYLLARLSDTVALVDPGQVEPLEAALLTAGHTPKLT